MAPPWVYLPATPSANCCFTAFRRASSLSSVQCVPVPPFDKSVRGGGVDLGVDFGDGGGVDFGDGGGVDFGDGGGVDFGDGGGVDFGDGGADEDDSDGSDGSDT